MPRWSKDNMSPLGQMRVNAGYSREALAAVLNISLSTVLRYETGVTDIPLGVAEDLSTIFNVAFDEIRDAAKATKEAIGTPITGHHLRAARRKLIGYA